MKKLDALRSLSGLMFLISLLSLVACTKDNKEAPKPTVSTKQLSISYLKDLSSAQSILIKDVGVIRGVVISDASSKNIDNDETLFLQDGTNQDGIMLTLQMDHSFSKLPNGFECSIKYLFLQLIFRIRVFI